MGDWPYRGKELLRVPLGDTGHDLVIRDDGDADNYTLAKIEKPDGNERSVGCGIMDLRVEMQDDREIVEILEDSLACSCTSASSTPDGPPPISKLPVTFACSDCGTRYARTRLANPREAIDTNYWLCEGCADDPSPYGRP